MEKNSSYDHALAATVAIQTSTEPIRHKELQTVSLIYLFSGHFYIIYLETGVVANLSLMWASVTSG